MIARAAWTLAQSRGPLAITMSQVADEAGVSRPTLYKYFADVETMLLAHHDEMIETHLRELEGVAQGAGGAPERLEALFLAYAQNCQRRAAHAGTHVQWLVHATFERSEAQTRLVSLFADVVQQAGLGRGVLSPTDLAEYSVRALGAAEHLAADKSSAVARLVLTSLR